MQKGFLTWCHQLLKALALFTEAENIFFLRWCLVSGNSHLFEFNKRRNEKVRVKELYILERATGNKSAFILNTEKSRLFENRILNLPKGKKQTIKGKDYLYFRMMFSPFNENHKSIAITNSQQKLLGELKENEIAITFANFKNVQNAVIAEYDKGQFYLTESVKLYVIDYEPKNNYALSDREKQILIEDFLNNDFTIEAPENCNLDLFQGGDK